MTLIISVQQTQNDVIDFMMSGCKFTLPVNVYNDLIQWSFALLRYKGRKQKEKHRWTKKRIQRGKKIEKIERWENKEDRKRWEDRKKLERVEKWVLTVPGTCWSASHSCSARSVDWPESEQMVSRSDRPHVWNGNKTKTEHNSDVDHFP